MQQRALIINASRLRLAYDKEAILQDASFAINEGEFVFLTGKSGSGKTTLLRSLYGEFANFGGELAVLGKNMAHTKGSALLALRRKMGIVFQDYKLINELNIEQNIALPLVIAGFSKAQVQRQTQVILGYIKLAHKAKAMPQQLSGGEQQRVAVGRAIIHNPRLIIADEPTGNLDRQSAEIVYSLLAAAHKSFNATVVVATHDAPAAFLRGARVLLIEDGGIHA